MPPTTISDESERLRPRPVPEVMRRVAGIAAGVATRMFAGPEDGCPPILGAFAVAAAPGGPAVLVLERGCRGMVGGQDRIGVGIPGYQRLTDQLVKPGAQRKINLIQERWHQQVAVTLRALSLLRDQQPFRLSRQAAQPRSRLRTRPSPRQGT
jgi:hypothetical protein